jgi:hypothetical protein
MPLPETEMGASAMLRTAPMSSARVKGSPPMARLERLNDESPAAAPEYTALVSELNRRWCSGGSSVPM